MTRKTILGILALPALVVLFLALTWIDGAATRSRLARLEKSMTSTVPFFTVTHRQVSGGLFSSTVEVHYEFNDKLLKGMAAASAKQTAYSVDRVADPVDVASGFTVRHHIQHGPIPGFDSLGLARIDTELVIPDEAKQELRKNIGTDQPLKVITRLGYLGGGTTTIDSPAFTYVDKRNSNRIDWRGITGRLNFTRGLNSQDGEVTLLGMNVKDDKGGGATLGPMRFDYDLKRVFKTLYAGKVSFTMERLAIVLPQPTATGNLEMRDLAYEVDTSTTGDYVDLVAKLGVGSMSVATLKSAGLHYDFSLHHVHGPTFAALSEKLRDNVSAVFGGDNKAAQQILAPYKEYGPILLEHQPELTIERVSMSLPEGTAQLTGKVSIPGYAHGDLDSGPMVLLPKIEATMDVTLDEGFLNRDWDAPSPMAAAPAVHAPAGKAPHARGSATDPMAPPSRIEAMKAQLAALEQQGFVTRNGSRLSSHLEFRHGALTVNGKPMGPPGAGR